MSSDPTEAAKEICLRLLSVRPRTRAELEQKLVAKDVDAAVVEQVLGRLGQVGLIDDAAFAELWVRSRHQYQGISRRALVMELRRKGVDGELAVSAADEVDDESEDAKARELVRKRLRSMTGLDEVTSIRRLVGMLARKGYSPGLAYRVVREELKSVGAETELLEGPLSEL
ncbi:MAG TPA: regulatory protein RecX [Pseudonocardiaceae bacterium]|nr:regulatory protein RecX [Pseudonocardiaceae bacterium]